MTKLLYKNARNVLKAYRRHKTKVLVFSSEEDRMVNLTFRPSSSSENTFVSISLHIYLYIFKYVYITSVYIRRPRREAEDSRLSNGFKNTWS